MSILSMLFQGCCGGGYGGYNAGFPTGVYSDICRQATWQTMLGGMNFPGVFGFGFNSYGTGGAAQPQVVKHTSGEASTRVTQAQVDNAMNDWQKLQTLCEKAEQYKNDESINKEALVQKVTDAQKGLKDLDSQILNQTDAIKELQGQLDEINSKKPINKVERDEVNAKIQNAQAELEKSNNDRDAQLKEIEKAKIELDAFNLAQEDKQDELEALNTKREAAYKVYNDLQQKMLKQNLDDISAKAAEQDDVQDKEVAGNWWSRTVINPKNTFNKQKRQIAKCMSYLAKGNRDQAISYAVNKGLISITGKSANPNPNVSDSRIKELCNLYNGSYYRTKE